MSLVSHPYIIRMWLACTRILSLYHSYILVCHSFVTHVHSYVICMSLVCTRMPFVCHSYVFVCIRMSSVCRLVQLDRRKEERWFFFNNPEKTDEILVYPYVTRMYLYVTRMYLYVIRMSLVCTRVSFVCHSYVLVCHSYVTRMWFHHEPCRRLLQQTRICSGILIRLKYCFYSKLTIQTPEWGHQIENSQLICDVTNL